MSSSGGTVLEHPVVAGARTAATGLDRSLRAQAWQAADTDIETALSQLAAVEAKTTALRAVLLAQAESRNLKDRTQALSTAQWLTQRFRYSRGLAAARLRDAELLAAQPAVRAALADGTVTVEQSRVVAAALARVDAIPAVTETDRKEAAGFLIAQAGALSPAELTRAGQALAEALTSTPGRGRPGRRRRGGPRAGRGRGRRPGRRDQPADHQTPTRRRVHRPVQHRQRRRDPLRDLAAPRRPTPPRHRRLHRHPTQRPTPSRPPPRRPTWRARPHQRR
jgi:hypothetical protein